jgi:hypothetical protein
MPGVHSNVIQVCAKCGGENPDQFPLCGFCGTPFAKAPEVAAPEEERKQITVVFVDMVGSTSRGEELDPEDVRRLLEPYYARLRARSSVTAARSRSSSETLSSRSSARRARTRTIPNAPCGPDW